MSLPLWMRPTRDALTPGTLTAPTHIAKPKRGEEIFEGTDYPREWEDFIGQQQAKEQLIVAALSAKQRGVRLDHTLLACGQYGVGKTTLAHLLAYQAGVGIVQATGPFDASKARKLMSNMSDNDVLLIDEVHSMVTGGKSKADWLLPFMTDGKLFTSEGAIECPDITIVGATTDGGKLPQTILSRFLLRPRLEAYTDDEAALIAANLAGRMGVKVQPEDLPVIARAASQNPRDMRSILSAIRDLQIAFPGRPYMDKALTFAGFSVDGLSVTAQEILLVLLYQDKHTASIDALGSLLSEPGPLRHHEQALLQRGLITVGGRGRQLTDCGIRRAMELRGES